MGETKHRSRRKKKGSIVSTIVLIIAIMVFAFSAFQLFSIFSEYHEGDQEYKHIQTTALKKGTKNDLYVVDFEALKKINPDTIGWIRFDEPSVINYPVVKSIDNVEYLTKTFQANDNKMGAIFVDMYNSPDFLDRNTFIYGHRMNNGSMFGELEKYADEEFCKEHPYFYIYTTSGRRYTYRVFSAGVVLDTSESYRATYYGDEDFEDYIEVIRKASNYQVDVEVNEASKIVSLSTCTKDSDNHRFLLHGVKVKDEPVE